MKGSAAHNIRVRGWRDFPTVLMPPQPRFIYVDVSGEISIRRVRTVQKRLVEILRTQAGRIKRLWSFNNPINGKQIAFSLKQKQIELFF